MCSGEAKCQGKDKRNHSSHSLMSPPGSVFFNWSWTARVLSATLSGCLQVTLHLEGQDVSSLDPLGQEPLGEVDLGAVVGQQHGNLFLATLEAVDA